MHASTPAASGLVINVHPLPCDISKVMLNADSPRECRKRAKEGFKADRANCGKMTARADKRKCMREARSKRREAMRACRTASKARRKEMRECLMKGLVGFENDIATCKSKSELREKARCHRIAMLKKGRTMAICRKRGRGGVCIWDAKIKRNNALAECWKTKDQKERRKCRKKAIQNFKADRAACKTK